MPLSPYNFIISSNDFTIDLNVNNIDTFRDGLSEVMKALCISKLIADCFYAGWWCDSTYRYLSVCVGFLYTWWPILRVVEDRFPLPFPFTHNSLFPLPFTITPTNSVIFVWSRKKNGPEEQFSIKLLLVLMKWTAKLTKRSLAFQEKI